MTPDTIITAELLAGLTKCPFCGAQRLHCTKTELTLECGTYMRLGMRADRMRGGGCMEQEIETLRARVLELEEAGDSLQKRLRIWSNLCGKRFVVGDEEAIANWIAVKKKGTKP